jgi:hypothetical protein
MSDLNNTKIEEQKVDKVEVSSKKPSPDQKQKFAVIFGGVAILTLIILVIGVGLTGSKDKVADADKDQAEVSTSTKDKDSELPEVSDSGREFFDSNAEVETPEEYKKVSEEIVEQRKSFEEYQTQENKVDIVSLASKDFNQSEVVKVKKQLKESNISTPVFETEKGAKVKLTIAYSSIGDQNFENGSLFVKLSQGLKIIPGSIEDTFNGKTVKVSDKVFDSSKGLIKYGPGSSDKAASKVSVDSKGTLTFVVEVNNEEINELAISSYLQDEGGKTGKPGFIFLEI